MKEPTSSKRSRPPGALKRRDLLCAAAVAGGAMIAAKTSASDVPDQRPAISDPQLRAAMLKYGGEFGEIGKGGSHGDL